MRKAEKGGLLLLGVGILDEALDLLARAGGIYADTPDLFDWAWRMIAGAFDVLGLSGLAIIAGLAIFVWGRWGDRLRARLHGRFQDSPQANGPEGDSEDLKASHNNSNTSNGRYLGIIARLDTIAEQLERVDRDSLAMLQYCENHLAYHILGVVRRDVPPDVAEYYDLRSITEEWIIEQMRMANEYVAHVSMRLGSTRWAADLRLCLAHAEAEGDRLIEALPTDRRPEKINPYQFRQYVIARTRFDWAVRFLAHEQREQEERMEDYLSGFQDRARNRQE